MKVYLDNPVDSQCTALAEIPGGLGLVGEEGDLPPPTPPSRPLRTNNPRSDQMCVCVQRQLKRSLRQQGHMGQAGVSQAH